MSTPEPPTDADDPTLVDGAQIGAKPRKRHRLRRVALVVVIVLAVLGGGGAVAGYLYVHHVDSKIQRVQAFADIPPSARPQKAPVAKDAMNYLILGSDTRDPNNTTAGESRSDTIILMHLNKDHSAAQLVSIPRDTWTHIPKSADGQYGNTNAKINAAYSWGGVPLTVETIEQFTGVRIDHVVLVDFAGFEQIIDALGGVDIYVDKAFTSYYSLLPSHVRHFDAGLQHMDGAMALDYSRERHAFPDGDFARIQHQQQMIKAVMDKAASGDLLANPSRLNSFLNATAKAVTVDSTLDIFSTANDLRHLRSGNLTFFTNPSSGTGFEGSESVVYPDRTADQALYDAMRQDLPLPSMSPPHL